MSPGDTSFLLFSSALVLLMTPGLAIFYAGMVRAKNVLSSIMHSLISMGIVPIIWVVFGYSLAFGTDHGGIIGGLNHLFFHGVGGAPSPDYASTVPHVSFALFQMMFAIITPALISGAIAERMKFSAYTLFITLWLVLVYIPLAHWVWGKGGWIGRMGALDFAGGTVVHISSGISALAAALCLGRRKGFPRESMPPHNLPLTILGAGILWFGWFGFNGGSALESSGLAAVAFTNTHVSAASGAFGWAFYEWVKRKKPTALGTASGAVAGLVAITPAAGFVTPAASILFGFLAGIVCYWGIHLKFRFGFDDSLDVVGIHGLGGTLGAILTGLFATTAINPAGANGLFYGNGKLLLIQAGSVIATLIYAFSISFGLLKLIDATVGLRVDLESEVTGLDLTQHGETGYNL
ncbi:MAG: ammonium transporter [Deltaproteobacteria bacterium]|nr:MAG: ammonium transporter [Deltaproteobacteria bacterium]